MRSDESIAIGIQRGNKKDMAELVERFHGPLLNYMFRMSGGNQLLAEDMVQEVFIRVMRKISLFDPQRQFRPWLYAIAANIARNYYQLADTRHTDSVDEDADYLDTSTQPEDEVIRSETSERIGKALTQMPDHQREVVILFYYEELPQREIAELLQIPLGTVKSRLSLGLRRLRSTLDEMEKQR